jgi:hypothetical protein
VLCSGSAEPVSSDIRRRAPSRHTRSSLKHRVVLTQHGPRRDNDRDPYTAAPRSGPRRPPVIFGGLLVAGNLVRYLA